MKKLQLLDLITIIHVSMWFFIIFGGFISVKYTEFNIYYFIPLIYMSYLFFDVCLFDALENNLGKNPEDSNIVYQYLTNMFKYSFKYSFKDPIAPQGLLVLGFIIGVTIIKNSKKN
jgi:hypothetical protein